MAKTSYSSGECDLKNMHVGGGSGGSGSGGSGGTSLTASVQSIASVQTARDAVMTLARKEQSGLRRSDPMSVPSSAMKGFAHSTRAQQRADASGYGDVRKALLKLARKDKRR